MLVLPSEAPFQKKHAVKVVFFIFLGGLCAEQLWWSVQQLERVVNDLPQAVLQREIIVHKVDQEIVVMNVLDDHSRRRLIFIELGPLLDPQGEGLVLKKTAQVRRSSRG